MISSLSNASLLPPGQFDLDMRAVRFGNVQPQQSVEVERALQVLGRDLDDGRCHSNVHTATVGRPDLLRREQIGHGRQLIMANFSASEL